LLRQYPEGVGSADGLEKLLGKVDVHLRFEEFQTTVREAEYHLLGRLWQGIAEDDRPAGRPIESSRGANLDRGIALAREALEALRLLEPSASARASAGQGLEEADWKTAGAGASEVLLLLALALERQAGSRTGEGRSALLKEAVSHLNLAESLDGHSPALYENRARLLRALGRKDEADADEKKGSRPPATFLDHHLRAAALHRRGQWLEAWAAYQSALALRPDEYWTLFRLAKVLENLHRYPEAENLLRGCIALRPADPTAYNNRGAVLLHQRKWEAAAGAFEAALDRDPDYLPAYGNLMLAHAEQKQVALAEQVYRRYLGRKPADRREHAWALNSLGLAYERSGRPDGALTNYEAAIERDEGYALAHHNRAILLAGMHREREAEQAVRRAIALEPDDGSHYYVLGNLFAGEGRSLDARKAYGKAVELSPRLWEAWHNRGVLLRLEHNYEEALEDLSRALALSPDNPEVLRERALVLASLRQFEAAFEDVRRLDLGHGEKGEVHRLRGKILGDMDRLKESEEELTLAIQEGPEEADGYRSRAVTRLRAGRWQGAINDFKDYLKKRPDADDISEVYNDLSVAYLSLGEREKAVGALKEALGALNKAVELRPTASVLTNRGNFYLRTGNPAPAVRDFGEALRLDPAFLRAWALRGQAQLRLGRYADAVSDLGRALEQSPDHYETLLYHALACHLGGDGAKARASLEKVVRDRPDHVRGRFARGVLDFLEEKWAESVGHLSQAEGDPVLGPWVLLLRAQAWLRLGPRTLPAATADAEARLKLLPGDGMAHLLAARVYARGLKEAPADAQQRQRQRALELLEGAVKLQPELARQLRGDPELEAVSQDPRLLRLVP
jgi:tetratricopeptide (TPR) repeat protein